MNMCIAGARAVRQRRAGGFTLVEVLVALFIMALLATLAWRGLDGILRARDQSRTAMDRTVRLATVLTQWEQDLSAMHDTGLVPPVSFDGQTLRITRRAEAGVVLVAWAVRNGVWQRWATPPVVTVAELQQLWLRSQQLVGNEPEQLTLATSANVATSANSANSANAASGWQIYFNRGGQWTNAQSTGDFEVRVTVAAPAAVASAGSGAATAGATATVAAAAASAASGAATTVRALLPDAVRLQITLDGQTLTRDIALGRS